MLTRIWFGILGVIIAGAIGGQTCRAQGSVDSDEFFELKIRPVLKEKCFKCHGPEKISHGLRLDSREALLRGGDRGPAIVPGKAQDSLLVRAIRRDRGDLAMPPDTKLPADVIRDFQAWIEGGAHWPKPRIREIDSPSPERHWAFQPVRSVPVPDDPSGWSANPIDAFIRLRLVERGLKPVDAADRRTLLRRVYFDLIGLPPTPEEVTDFILDDTPDAFAKVVDRLLASEHYGERWGRHWMDVVRYADTAGDNADYPIPEAHLYRDYIVDAFNADKPYDLFIREQLAGDILTRNAAPGQIAREVFADQTIATGFLALSRRYATGPYELWHVTLEDAIDTTGRAFMGLSLRCARCHDHKYDPVTTADYYALYGIFSSTRFPYAGSEEFFSQKRPREGFQPLLPPDEALPIIAKHRQQLSSIDDEIARLERINKPTREELQSLNALRQQRQYSTRSNLPAELPAAYAVSEGTVGDASIQIGGDPLQPGPVVARGAIKFFETGAPLKISENSSGRLELANWLAQPTHPLTARVMVNRIWQHHFGKGLVITPSDFGLRGEPPTHPELLDWLAKRFVDSGWSIKTMHRLIILSKTYQLSSRHDAGNASIDSENRQYWRGNRRRLDAEAIRDAMLAVSGMLERQRPQEHPFRAIVEWDWTQHRPFHDVFSTPHRSVYLMTQRLQKHPYLAIFDGPDTNTSTGDRGISIVPTQALFLMNGEFVRTVSEAMAEMLVARIPESRERIQAAYQLAYSRSPIDAELDRALRYIDQYAAELKRVAAPASRTEIEVWQSFLRTVLIANEFRFLD